MLKTKNYFRNKFSDAMDLYLNSLITIKEKDAEIDRLTKLNDSNLDSHLEQEQKLCDNINEMSFIIANLQKEIKHLKENK